MTSVKAPAGISHRYTCSFGCCEVEILSVPLGRRYFRRSISLNGSPVDLAALGERTGLSVANVRQRAYMGSCLQRVKRRQGQGLRAKTPPPPVSTVSNAELAARFNRLPRPRV